MVSIFTYESFFLQLWPAHFRAPSTGNSPRSFIELFHFPFCFLFSYNAQVASLCSQNDCRNISLFFHIAVVEPTFSLQPGNLNSLFIRPVDVNFLIFVSNNWKPASSIYGWIFGASPENTVVVDFFSRFRMIFLSNFSLYPHVCSISFKIIIQHNIVCSIEWYYYFHFFNNKKWVTVSLWWWCDPSCLVIFSPMPSITLIIFICLLSMTSVQS